MISNRQTVGEVLAALRRGESLIAVGPDKRPWYSWKRYQEAPADEDQLALWCEAPRCTGFAVVTGAVSRLCVLDFDGDEGRRLLERVGLDPHVRTGRGNFHLRIVHPGFHVATQNSKVTRLLEERWPGLDIRGDGGYAIEWGRTEYGAYETLRPLDRPYFVADLPTDIAAAVGLLGRGVLERALEEFSARDGGTTRAEAGLRPLRGKIPEGHRHRYMLEIGSAMVGRGESLEDVEAELLRVNAEECDPPKDERLVRELARDLHRRYWEPAPAEEDPGREEGRPEPEAAPEPEPSAAGRWGLIDGATFVLDAPEGVPAVWGEGQEVVWPRGEPLGMVGPQGVGKTTVLGQLLRGLLGLDARLLDLPVAAIEGKVLLLALDRPAQAARALRRVLSEDDRDVLSERLVIRRHRLPFDLLKEPAALAQMAADVGAGAVLLDTAKDTGLKLSTDEGGGAFNDALQAVVEKGIEIAFSHHQRKATSENRKPKTLADVWGSTWVTAGCGSVLLLWGAPGDAVIELSHLKQPAEEIGPLTVVHDQRRGVSTVDPGEHARMIDVVRERGGGVTVREAAIGFYGVAEPDRNTIEKARRKLETLAEDGLLVRTDRPGEKGPVATYSDAAK